MRYVSGTYALNLQCPEGTAGDWHFCCLDWNHPLELESAETSFGEWGIYESRDVPGREKCNVATHARACLDLLELGKFSSAQGMREQFLGRDYPKTAELFGLVARLRQLPAWEDVDAFMGSEYLCAWLDYKEALGL